MSLLSVGITAGGTNTLEAVMVVAADTDFHVYRRHRNLPRSYELHEAVTTISRDVWASLWPTRLRRGASLFSSPRERRSRDAEWISLTTSARNPLTSERQSDHSAGPVWTGASGVITWLAVSVRFCSGSVWSIAGLNVAATAWALQITEHGAWKFAEVFQIEGPIV